MPIPPPNNGPKGRDAGEPVCEACGYELCMCPPAAPVGVTETLAYLTKRNAPSGNARDYRAYGYRRGRYVSDGEGCVEKVGDW